MGRFIRVFEKLHLLILVGNVIFCSYINGANLNGTRCIKSEKEALGKFKNGLIDPSNRLFSWVGENCCMWKGVGCDNKTDHVIKLDLGIPIPNSDDDQDWLKFDQSRFRGKINRSLINLRHLNYLDLSGNDFSGVEIPSFLGSLQKLKYLNLASSQLSGKISYQLGNLSDLQYLDLGWNYFKVDNLNFLSSLSSLKQLDLSLVDLSSCAATWLHSINKLHTLVELRLPNCHLSHIPTVPYINFTSLIVLDLKSNDLNSTFPRWLSNISHIEYVNLSSNALQGSIYSEIGNSSVLSFLDLSENELQGEIPVTFSSLCNLVELNLADNKFHGSISGSFESPAGCIQRNLKVLNLESNNFSGNLPVNLGQFKHLEKLSLFSNSFQGSIPTSIGQLANLEIFDVHNNSLDGIVSQIHFSELVALRYLSVEGNSLVFNVGAPWVPPFQLQAIELSSCRIGPGFPQWLQTQRNISALKMSNAGISGSMPTWFEHISSNIRLLDLSHNQITNALPKLSNYSGDSSLGRRIYLDSNKFDGPLTGFPSDVDVLDVSNNLLRGQIPRRIGKMMPGIEFLSLSNNHLNGSIPRSICEMESLIFLDMSRNQLSGRLPQCQPKLTRLYVIDLANNNLTGHIPNSFSLLQQLVSLHLGNNCLDGSIPVSLQNLNLWTLDLSMNAFAGPVPSWLGENLSSLRILDIHSNKFNGEIPTQLCRLESLSILNLAENEMTGSIPSCFGNLSAMAFNEWDSDDSWSLYPVYDRINFDEHIMAYVKGRQLHYSRTVQFLSSIDLSNNRIVGEIPKELTSLSRLKNLNLSRNQLKGHIPAQIGNLKMLESLDLSINELSGSIPPSLSKLNFLSHLNLSFNNLCGHIPAGNQLQALDDKSIYIGNEGLCGPPAQNMYCPGDEPPKNHDEQAWRSSNVQNKFEMVWFCSGLGVGFLVGFVGVCSTLYLNDSFRYACFGAVERMYDKVWVVVAIQANKLGRKLLGENIAGQVGR